MTDPTLLTLLERLLAEAKRPPEDLWDAKQCAEYLHTEEREFLRGAAKHPAFPGAIPVTGNARGKKFVWVAKEVRRWAVGMQGKAA